METEIMYIWTKEKDKTFDLHLNSEYEFIFDETTLFLNYKKNPYFVKDFFGQQVKNIVAMVGENGSGKTTNLKKIIMLLEDPDKILFEYIVIIRKNEKIYYYTNIKKELVTHKEILKKNTEQFSDLKDSQILFYSNVFDTNNIGVKSKKIIDLSTNQLLEKYSNQNKDINHYRQRENKKHIYFTITKKEDLGISNYVEIPPKIEVVNNRMLIDHFNEDTVIPTKIKSKIEKNSLNISSRKKNNKFDDNPHVIDIFANISIYLEGQFLKWLYNFVDILNGNSRNLYNIEIFVDIKKRLRAELELESLINETTVKFSDENLDDIIDRIEYSIKQILNFGSSFLNAGLNEELESLKKELHDDFKLEPTMIKDLVSIVEQSVYEIHESIYHEKEGIFEKQEFVEKIERLSNEIKVDTINIKTEIEKTLLKAGTSKLLSEEINRHIKEIFIKNIRMKKLEESFDFFDESSDLLEDEYSYDSIYDINFDESIENVSYKKRVFAKINRNEIYTEKEAERVFISNLLNSDFYLKYKEEYKAEYNEQIDSSIQENFQKSNVIDELISIFSWHYKELNDLLSYIQNFLEKTSMSDDKVLIDTDSPWLKDFILKYGSSKYNILLDFEWRNLSSGEYSFLSFMSRLYDISTVLGKGNQNLVLIIDEGELYFHPQWQKKYINLLIRALEIIIPTGHFQVLLTTHSPFLLSDLPDYNVRLLKKGDEKAHNTSLLKNDRTFGANIQELFMNSFFLEGGLTGEFSKGKINSAIKEVLDYNEETYKKNDYYENFFKLIGEPIVRKKTLSLLNEKEKNFILTNSKKEAKKNAPSINEEIEFLQKKLDMLYRMKVNQDKKDNN